MAASTPTPTAEPLDTYTLNMGPQHPSTHGVLRLKLTLRGERLVAVEPVIGYSHRAHEKMAENRSYAQFLPNTSRQDYLSGLIYNLAWVEAVEKLAGIPVPERALVARVILSEFNRISSHLLWIGAFLLDLGAATPFLYTFDDREAILFLLESPGPMASSAHGSGFISVDNDDPSAERCWRLSTAAGLSRDSYANWNVVPW